MTGQNLTKILFAVELDGKPYGVEFEGDKLLQLSHHLAEQSPNGVLSLEIGRDSRHSSVSRMS
jgi:hypothetical protein